MMLDDRQPDSRAPIRSGWPAPDITIAIADDDARVRHTLLGDHPRFETVAAVGSGIALVQLCATVGPRVALIDVMMPTGDEMAIRAEPSPVAADETLAETASPAAGAPLWRRSVSPRRSAPPRCSTRSP